MHRGDAFTLNSLRLCLRKEHPDIEILAECSVGYTLHIRMEGFLEYGDDIPVDLFPFSFCMDSLVRIENLVDNVLPQLGLVFNFFVEELV